MTICYHCKDLPENEVNKGQSRISQTPGSNPAWSSSVLSGFHEGPSFLLVAYNSLGCILCPMTTVVLANVKFRKVQRKKKKESSEKSVK